MQGANVAVDAWLREDTGKGLSGLQQTGVEWMHARRKLHIYYGYGFAGIIHHIVNRPKTSSSK